MTNLDCVLVLTLASLFASTTGCASRASDAPIRGDASTPDGTADKSTPSTDPSDPAADRCQPGGDEDGRECSATSAPCPSHLDCIYAPGCANPTGKCRNWARCPDTANIEYVCDCNGQTKTSAFSPFASRGPCVNDDGGLSFD